MKHLGIEATKNFNGIQAEIKLLLAEMIMSLEKSNYKTYSERLQKKINPRLNELFELRDKYI